MGQKLLNKQTGVRELIDDDQVAGKLASGDYVAPDAVAVHAGGVDTYTTPDLAVSDNGVLQHAIDPAQLAAEQGHKIREDRNSGAGGTLKALAGGFVKGLSFDTINPFQEAQEFHGAASTTGEIAGVVAPMLVGDEANLAAFLTRDAAEMERAGATLSSKFLFSGEAGAEAGSAAKSVERGLSRAGKELDAAKRAASVSEDLRAMDAPALKAAREREVARIGEVKQLGGNQLVDELGTFRNQLKNDDQIFLVTKDLKESAMPIKAGPGTLKIQEVAALNAKADQAINGILRNPKFLAENPKRAYEALRAQEHALEQIQAREDSLRALFVTDKTGTRAAALDRVAPALERNRALQGSIKELIAEPASERLTAIDAAKEAMQAGGKRGALEDMLSGGIMGHVAGMFTGLPIIGPMIGAKVGRFATDLVFGRMGKALAASGERAGAAVSKFLQLAPRAATTPQAMVLSSKTLARLAYGPRAASNDNKPDLAALYKARTAEIKRQTAYGPDGKPVMRPDARMAMAKQLAPIRAVAPIVADKIEALAARRLAFLSSKIPRRPDAMGQTMGGPDHWQPAELDMRQFARYAAAVEDPAGIVERLADGTISPEDGEVMRTVYPDLFAKIHQQIAVSIPTLRKTLSYKRRVALSIFAGLPVDPAMQSNILEVLQGSFEQEQGTDGGTQQATAAPAFGSIKKSTPEPTPAQSRAG